jgi:hypothetical protein
VTDVSSLSRRAFFAAGGATFLAACGNSGSASQSDQFEIAPRWSNDALAPGVQRLALSIVRDGALATDGPSELSGVVRDSKGAEVMSLTAKRRSQGITSPYWDFRSNVDAAGIYYLVVDGGPPGGQAFEVFDAAKVTVPTTGRALPPFDTPTVADHRGVEPYCTRLEGPCPLHDITLTDALAKGNPVAYMIGTPAHCQFGTCAPALEFLMAGHTRLGNAVTMVHADVYLDNTATVTTPAVQALNLTYEPVLFLTNSSGIVVDRLDAVWDQSELDEALAKLTA